MYFDADRVRALAKCVKRTTPKEYGQFINHKKAKSRGGRKRGKK